MKVVVGNGWTSVLGVNGGSTPGAAPGRQAWFLSKELVRNWQGGAQNVVAQALAAGMMQRVVTGRGRDQGVDVGSSPKAKKSARDRGLATPAYLRQLPQYR
ncbi:hypothetical protein NEUTE1DRAFT_142420 [Neurospora tetrasperma FGSC 2508]|uniref:Uncharacterized protein n=1 Tax=Neurospora tetrasperma (strain FGSC 2508 / ATCC MYA-4615 / P0657) TaxID=510951 RepID=F8N325_NEUT8|nr:uncharacterized protein NEUTE1DRAFT_142420 [Neurospora tetrasperma FGSC 2508]EGO52536.1 hypothetical protein NEUTE1DRAFT_142420 [Neurospora tetrasperma FGSC 2508]